MNLLVVATAAGTNIQNGQFSLTNWVPWMLGIVLVWLLTRALVSQQELAQELRSAQSLIYQRARDAALHDERQRLARELHDAVSQTLFAASLIADVLPRIWERDQERAGGVSSSCEC